MNLLDHFHPPLSTQRHWEGFYSKWASSILDQLNGQLPPRYFAEPHVQAGSNVEIDVATFEQTVHGGQDAVGTLVWSPAKATMTAPLSAAKFDVFEVQVLNDEAGPKLVAAIELVSPANKDRPETRNAFAIKCAAYLQQSIAVIVVDVVTSRSADLHLDILKVMQLAEQHQTSSLWAGSFRLNDSSDARNLDIWWNRLAVGEQLPELPLWLNQIEAVPVDFSESYESTCRSLRIDGARG